MNQSELADERTSEHQALVQNAMAALKRLDQGEDVPVNELEWPEAVRPTAAEYNAVLQVTNKLHFQERYEKALAVARSLLAAMPENGELGVIVARLCLDRDEVDQAAELHERFGDQSPGWMAIRAVVANRQRRFAEAVSLTQEYVDKFPALQFKSQRKFVPVVAILNAAPPRLGKPFNPRNLHFSGNLPSQMAHLAPNRFHYVSLLVGATTLSEAQKKLPTPDAIVNNVVNGERLANPKMMEKVTSVLDFWGRPCINSPQAAVRTARDRLSTRLQNQPNLIAPLTRFFLPKKENPSLADEIVETFGLPVIMRPPFFQHGQQAVLAQTPEEVDAAVKRLAGGFFAIKFILNQVRPGLYRKMRAAFVEDRMYMLRVDWGEDWMIHGDRNEPHREKFYRDNPNLLEEERAICRDPVTELGAEAVAALRFIRSRVELDYFGIDFDVTSEGKAVLFEANASMNLLNKPNYRLKHPAEQQRAFLSDFFSMVTARSAHA